MKKQRRLPQVPAAQDEDPRGEPVSFSKWITPADDMWLQEFQNRCNEQPSREQRTKYYEELEVLEFDETVCWLKKVDESLYDLLDLMNHWYCCCGFVFWELTADRVDGRFTSNPAIEDPSGDDVSLAPFVIPASCHFLMRLMPACTYHIGLADVTRPIRLVQANIIDRYFSDDDPVLETDVWLKEFDSVRKIRSAILAYIERKASQNRYRETEGIRLAELSKTRQRSGKKPGRKRTSGPLAEFARQHIKQNVPQSKIHEFWNKDLSRPRATEASVRHALRKQQEIDAEEMEKEKRKAQRLL